MPQVVEGQALDTSRLTDLLEGLGDRIGAHISGRMAYAPYPAIDTPGQDVQDAQGRRGKRHPPGRPGLRFRDQEYPGLTVHVVPAHGRDLPATHGGLDGPDDDIGDTDPRMRARVIGLCGRQEASLLIADQAAVTSTGELGALALDEVYGVRQGLHAPGGAGGIEEMGEQGETDPNRVRGQAPRL